MHWLDRIQQLRALPERLIVGLMSGTSLDGVDAAVVRITGSGPGLSVETLSFTGRPYTAEQRETLGRVATGEPTTAQELTILDAALADLFADVALEAIADAGLQTTDLHLAASHGHTVWHQPQIGRLPGWAARHTLQIGEPDRLAHRLGLPVAFGFRTRDMEVGGQGAPLVPYMDWLLLAHPTEWRAALNLGGIANCTLLPPGAAPNEVIAFDTGPANMLMDTAVKLGSNGAESFDRAGRYSQGDVDENLLAQLMTHPFLSATPPKSTGREEFGEPFLRAHVSGDYLAAVPTLCEFTARSVADNLRRFGQLQPGGRLIASGGGVHNPALLARLRANLPELTVESIANFGINPDAKEAVAFAIFGNELLAGRPANLPSATGAAKPVLMGKLAFPTDWSGDE